ncbi:TetR/AcrR family transcriptional regulator [Pseudonocardia sp.]|uniref:TetR/AcrR family transcriptional regulator n=1 Tax=Pseudonocardia sp. TaxID=60912 RepID=UPI003D0BB149
MTVPAGPRRMSPQRRRAHIVAVALELYRRLPPERVSVEDVARAAGVSRPLVYRYFGSAEELHAAALEQVVDELLAALVVDPGGDLLADLRTALDVFLDVVERHAVGYVALMRSGSVLTWGQGGVQRVRSHIESVILRRIGDGHRLAVVGWIAAVETTCVLWLQERPMPRAAFRDYLAALLVAMVGVTVQR